MNKFFQYAAEVFIRPQKIFAALRRDPHRVGYGVLGHVVLAVVYFIAITTSLGMDALPCPGYLVLNIPSEQYYNFERFFILPVGIAGTILASGVIRLTARLWEGKGKFEDHFALLGFSLIIVATIIGLPDLVIGILIGNGILLPLSWAYIGPHVWLGTLWYILLMGLTVREVEGLSWGKSLALTMLGFVTNGIVQFIFIR